MCGIIGYIGESNAVPVLLDGLGRLEYRGYDSAGIAVLNGKGKMGLRKTVGVLSHLVEEVKRKPLAGHLGIGHTRWATHGKPSTQNCHPHQDCSKNIQVVHNGIIENYAELKQQLLKKGHRFCSETDTEVIAHLVEEEFKAGAKDLVQAVQRCLKKAKGAYALGIICSKDPHLLVAARQGSPLVLGIGKNEKFIASDATAILHRTRDIVYLEDGRIAAINSKSSKIFDQDGNACPLDVRTIQWEYEASAKGPYEKFMAKEMHEQPEILQRMLQRRVTAKGVVDLEDVPITPAQFKKIRRVHIVSCGTAYYAGLVGKYMLEKYLSIPVEVESASEFRYRARRGLGPHTLVVPVTQSGETADTLAGLRDAKVHASPVLAICNAVGSTIARESDGVFYTHAGPEIAVASTKAYTAQLMAFHLLTMYLGRLRGEMSAAQSKTLLNALQKVPVQLEHILMNEGPAEALAQKYYQTKSVFYLGRGFNYPTALEAALKNKEISYMHAEGYPAGELKHGPIAMIDADFPVVCICTKSATYDKMVSNIKEVEARNAKIVLVANEGDKAIRAMAADILAVPETLEEVSPMLNIVPLQMFAYHVARLKGCDIDKPRNLAKSVTVE